MTRFYEERPVYKPLVTSTEARLGKQPRAKWTLCDFFAISAIKKLLTTDRQGRNENPEYETGYPIAPRN